MTDSPFMRRGNPKDKGAPGRRAETLIAKRVGGKVQPGSGALAGAKGDVKVESSQHQFLMENKSSTGKSFSLQQDWLLKIYREALAQNRVPALSFQFVDSQGKSGRMDRWVCLPEHIALALIHGEEL